MNNLLTLEFWFNLRPGALLPIYERALEVFLIALFILFLAGWLLVKRKRSFYTFLWQKLYTFCVVNVFIGLVILFLNYELVPFLSARFWFLVWGVEMITWLVFVFLALKAVPEKKKKIEEEKKFKKYIP